MSCISPLLSDSCQLIAVFHFSVPAVSPTGVGVIPVFLDDAFFPFGRREIIFQEEQARAVVKSGQRDIHLILAKLVVLREIGKDAEWMSLICQHPNDVVPRNLGEVAVVFHLPEQFFNGGFFWQLKGLAMVKNDPCMRSHVISASSTT